MRTPSGIIHVVDFKTDQIVSIIQPKDYWDDKRHWEIKNNIDMLDFTTFDGTEHAITLQQQNLVLKEVRDGRVVPYVITETEKNSDNRSITAYASGAWVQIVKSGIINPQRIESKTVNEFLDIALLGMKWKRGNTEYAGFHTMTIDEFIDPLTFLKKIASLFDLEIQYRVEVVGSQIVGWYVDMVKKRGRETGKEVELGKDLIGVKRIEHSRDICTALVGFVRGEGEKVITVESINNGLPYITDSDAFQRWNEHGKHKFGFYTPETEEQNMTPQRLMTLVKTEFKKRVNTSVSYEVEAQSIGRVFGLAHELINEGDTIKIKDTDFTPKLYLEARVIAGDESFTDPTQDKYVFGDYREIMDANEELRKIYNRILSSLGNKQEMIDQLDKLVKEANETASNAKKESEAAKTLAEKVQENIKNNTVEIIESKNPPTTGLKDRKTLWLDISNGKPGILKLWKDGFWDPVVPDVEKVKKETLEQVNKDIESTKTELNQKVQAVDNKAQEIAGQISDVKKEVQGKVDSNFVKEQIKDKADKSGVFTKDEINNGFVGKQIYETDKQGNVKKFQEIITSFEQTNEAIKSKAEKQSVTDLGNNLTQVSKTANEAKQTAEGNTRTISQVDSKVNQTVTDFTKKTTAIEETVNGVSTKVTNIQTEQGKLTERVTKSEQTADGFKTSIESLTKKDTEISNKLNTVESTVEGTKKTISDVQQTTNDLKKTTTEITEKAGKISEKLESVETTVNNTTIDGENYIINSSGKNERPVMYDDKGSIVNKAAMFYGTDYIGITCNDYTDSFYQLGNSTNNTLRDFEVNKDSTLSFEMENDMNGVDIIVFQFINNVWNETKAVKKINATSGWQRFSYTFKLDVNTKGWFIRFRFPRNVESNGKNIRFKKVKLEKANTPTAWSRSRYDLTPIDEFTKKTTEIEKSVDGIKETVTKVENNQSGFDKRVTEVEKTANGITQSVSKLQETQMQQGKTLTQATTALEQHSEALNLTMKKKDVEDYVGGLGTINELRNADFEKDLKYWSVNRDPGTTVSVDKNLKYKGMNSFQFNTSGLDQNRWWGISGDFIACQVGEDFVASAYFITDGKPPAFDPGTGCFVEIEYWTSDKKTRITTSRTKVNLTNHTWVRCVNTSKAPANTGFVRWRVYNERNGRFWLSAPMMQRGTVAAEFWLHPKDQTDADKMIEDIANRVVTEQYDKKMTQIDNRFTINEQGLDLKASKTEVYTQTQSDGRYAKDTYVKDLEGRIQITEKNILSTVKKGEVISSINQTAEKIKISADLIDLVGKVEASWLKAGLLQGTTIKTSATKEYLHMENQVLRFVNQDTAKMIIGFENEYKSKTLNPYIILGQGDGSGKNFGSIYKDGNGVYYRYVDLNGVESSIRLTAQGNVGITAQSSMWLNSNGQIVLDGKNVVAISVSGRNVADFKQVNGVNFDLILGGNHMLRSSTAAGYDKFLQIKNVNGNEFRGLEVAEITAHGGIRSDTNLWAEQNSYAMQHINRSTEKIKTAIHDLPFSPLEKVRGLKVKEYFLKRDMHELYQMRMNKPEDRVEPYTTSDIEVQYGLIAEETDELFTTKEKDGIKLYTTLSILTAGVQELEVKHDEEIKALEEKHSADMEEMNRRIEVLEQLLVQNLINIKPEQL